MSRRLPPEYVDRVNQEKWGKAFDVDDEEDHTAKIVTGYILYRLTWYQTEQHDDYKLWAYFREDFQDWTKETFALGNTDDVRNLRDHLRAYGVYVPRDGRRIAENLAIVVSTDEYHEWTEAEANEELKLNKAFHSHWNPTTDKYRIPTLQNTPRTPYTSLQRPRYGQTDYPTLPQPVSRSDSHRQDNLPTFSNPPPLNLSFTQFPNPTPPTPTNLPEDFDRRVHNPTREQTPYQYQESPDRLSKQLTELMKIYNNDEKKFTGEMYDILDTKLRVFYDCCAKVGLPDTQYHNAFSVMLKGRAATFYYDNLSGKGYGFKNMISKTKIHFETEENRQLYLSEWRVTTLSKTITDNPDKTRLECLQILFDTLQKIQRGLNVVYQTEYSLREQVINACRGVAECNLALYNPADTYEGVCAQLRSSIGTAMRTRESQQQQQFTAHPDDDFDSDNQYDHNWTDRTYGGQGRYRGMSRGRSRGSSRGFQRGYAGRYQDQPRQKKCYVCEKPGCWSTRHTSDERQQAFGKFRRTARETSDREPTMAYFQSFLAQFEGVEGLSETDHETEQLLAQMEIGDESVDQFFTEYGKIDGVQTVSALNDQSAFHAITKVDVFNEPIDSSVFTFEDRYSANIFQGIMPDSGAAGVSTAGEPQVAALQRLDPTVQLDTSTAGQHNIRFGKGMAVSLGTIQVPTPLGIITFHVVPADTPFLFCIQDMDRMGVKLDNLKNVLIQGKTVVPVIRKWGHPWMLLHHHEQSVAWSHLTESELRRLHRRFGHPSVQRLFDILQRAGHGTELQAIKHLTKYCHQCQMNGKSPGRFKFTLRDDYNFNFEVIIDVMYLDGKPVLQVVDAATSFQAARFLKDMSAKNAWETLRLCWIDTYQGPPDYIAHDAGKNFASTEFKQYARSMAIEVKEVPVEAHNSIGKVERYHQPLRRAYEIIRDELQDGVNAETALQMAVKAVNDSAGPDGIVPTLLVFGAYPRMTEGSAPSPSVIQRAEAIRKATKEVRRLHAERQVQDALAMRNGPSTKATLNLPLQSDVRVWREKDGWTGPFKLLATDGETCTIDMPHGPTNFRSTVVKPYYILPLPEASQEEEEIEKPPDDDRDEPIDAEEQSVMKHPMVVIHQPAKRGRGRPRGSKNKIRHTENDRANFSMSFMTGKERADQELSLELRKQGKITTPGAPFEASDKQEIDNLIGKDVFNFEQYDPVKHGGIRIFKSRLVREIKGKATNAPYEKSRLVIQGYQDDGKEMILTQSPTIQRASQRVIVALAPSLVQLQDRKMNLWLRDISQAYVQSTTKLNRMILAQLPKEIQHLYPEGTIMVVIRPLYGIAEAGTHWWATYSKHHKDKLFMATSTYDPCLLVTTTEDGFGIVGMQTDDTIILADEPFSTLEENELLNAKFIAKPKEKLTPDSPLIFNGCVLVQDGNTMSLRQKEQGKKIKLIDIDAPDARQKYVEQRARGAYIASICQPEAAFDLSVAAQHQKPTKEDVIALNKRLKWQVEHLDRGLTYISLDVSTAKLFVFVDGSFANNKDYSSQIGYEIILANETTENDEFTINGNLIHWSSTKSKRVTRSVLASEIYGMVGGVDMSFAIGSTLTMIMKQLGLPTIPIIVCTDSYSLYECLVKLGTTKEKRLMIDIMAIRESYENRELFEIRWINGQDNPADAMTKSNPNKALETFIDTNSLRIRVEGWVKRSIEHGSDQIGRTALDAQKEELPVSG